jgi:hypothetical protein
MRATHHIPDVASWSNGATAAIQAEFYSDGTASDTALIGDLSYVRIMNGGHANGIADVDDDVALFSFQGHTIGSGNMIASQTSAAVSHTIRVKVGTATYYLMASTLQ